MDSTNKRVDNFMTQVTADLTEIKKSLEYSQNDIADLDRGIKAVRDSQNVPLSYVS